MCACVCACVYVWKSSVWLQHAYCNTLQYAATPCNRDAVAVAMSTGNSALIRLLHSDPPPPSLPLSLFLEALLPNPPEPVCLRVCVCVLRARVYVRVCLCVCVCININAYRSISPRSPSPSLPSHCIQKCFSQVHFKRCCTHADVSHTHMHTRMRTFAQRNMWFGRSASEDPCHCLQKHFWDREECFYI